MKELSFEDFEETLFSQEDPYQLHLNESDDVEAFRRAWLKLDARSQYLLEARYILNKSYDEIALELNIKPSSVRVAMTRTKEKAKRLILAEKSSAQVKETVEFPLRYHKIEKTKKCNTISPVYKKVPHKCTELFYVF